MFTSNQGRREDACTIPALPLPLTRCLIQGPFASLPFSSSWPELLTNIL